MELIALSVWMTSVAWAGVTAGQPAPPLSLPSTSGEPVELAALQGQVVVVSFWASWCGPCRTELPMLVDLQERLGPRGLRVLAVNVDDQDAARDRFLKKTPLALTVLDDSEQQVVSAYDIAAMPTTVVIDADGVVRGVHAGFDKARFGELEAEITALLPPTPPG